MIQKCEFLVCTCQESTYCNNRKPPTPYQQCTNFTGKAIQEIPFSHSFHKCDYKTSQWTVVNFISFFVWVGYQSKHSLKRYEPVQCEQFHKNIFHLYSYIQIHQVDLISTPKSPNMWQWKGLSWWNQIYQHVHMSIDSQYHTSMKTPLLQASSYIFQQCHQLKVVF